MRFESTVDGIITQKGNGELNFSKDKFIGDIKIGGCNYHLSGVIKSEKTIAKIYWRCHDMISEYELTGQLSHFTQADFKGKKFIRIVFLSPASFSEAFGLVLMEDTSAYYRRKNNILPFSPPNPLIRK